MVKPMPFAELDYAPQHGTVEVQGENSLWCVEVDIEQGKAMEADGLDVWWVSDVIPLEQAKARAMAYHMKARFT